MAEDSREGKPRDEGLTNALFAGIIVILFLNFLAFVPGVLEERYGLRSSFLDSLQSTAPLTEDTPLGTRIIQKKDGTLFAIPSENPLGTISKGATGEVVSGPVLRKGKLWWKIKYDDGTEGWIRRKDIAIDKKSDRSLIKGNTPLGSKIVNGSDTRLFSGPDGFLVNTKTKGERGSLIDGPVLIGDVRWWKVRYNDGTEEWVQEDDVILDEERNFKAIKANTPVGTKIKNSARVQVFEQPQGQLLGEQGRGAIGTIISGPEFVGTERWWDIDYEKGVDGWVQEHLLERHISLIASVKSTSSFFKWLSFLISILLIFGIAYLVTRMWQVGYAEQKQFAPIKTLPSELPFRENRRWEKVIEYVNTDNPNNWRLAILEADILLDEMVVSLGYQGERLGEKLLQIEESDFLTLNKAWEAHKTRNKIAHEGAEYRISQLEARRIIRLYEEVFKEFFFISDVERAKCQAEGLSISEPRS